MRAALICCILCVVVIIVNRHGYTEFAWFLVGVQFMIGLEGLLAPNPVVKQPVHSTFHTTCPSCRGEYSCPLEEAGASNVYRCPGCGKRFER